MKKILLILCVLLFTQMAYAENVIVNPTQKIGTIPCFKFQSFTSELRTTKIKTEEGTYRIFIIQNQEGVNITAVKIDKK